MQQWQWQIFHCCLQDWSEFAALPKDQKQSDGFCTQA